MRVKLSDTNTTKLQPKKDPDGKPRLAELLDTEVAGLLVRVNEQRSQSVLSEGAVSGGHCGRCQASQPAAQGTRATRRRTPRGA